MEFLLIFLALAGYGFYRFMKLKAKGSPRGVARSRLKFATTDLEVFSALFYGEYGKFIEALKEKKLEYRRDNGLDESEEEFDFDLMLDEEEISNLGMLEFYKEQIDFDVNILQKTFNHADKLVVEDEQISNVTGVSITCIGNIQSALKYITLLYDNVLETVIVYPKEYTGDKSYEHYDTLAHEEMWK